MIENKKPLSERGELLGETSQEIIHSGLWIKILIGMALGVAFGLTLSPYGGDFLSHFISDEESKLAALKNISGWIELLGIIFLGLIKMVVVPLITCSIILGITDSGNLKFVGKLGMRIVPYFILTTAIAITIGLVMVSITEPGMNFDQAIIEKNIDSDVVRERLSRGTFEDLTIPQRIANMMPTNPAEATLNRNMLQIVIGSILVGMALLQIRNHPHTSNTTAPLIELCRSIQVLAMHIIGWAMKIAPFAVFGLLGKVTIELGYDALQSVAVYSITVLASLLIMMIVYMIIIALFTGRNIKDFLSKIREVQIIAFSTSSSAATMPVTIQAAEEKLKLNPEVSRFIVPLGATINMDGTALYQAVAAVFLAQAFGIDLTLGETILLLITTIGASIGTPATPGVGIVVLATILSGIGVPAEGIGLIIGVDRLLDMCRTTVNVTGDITAATVMDKWIKIDNKAETTPTDS